MILGNDVLLSLPPTRRPQLEGPAGRRGVNERDASIATERRSLAAVKPDRSLPKEQWPTLERPKRWHRDDDYEDRLKRLKVVRDGLMQEFELRPGIIAANQLLSEIARTLPGDLDALGHSQGCVTTKWSTSVSAC